MNQILQIARSVRKEIVDYYESTTGVCLEASRTLKEKLVVIGYQSEIVQGTFTIDNPNYTASSGLVLNEEDFDSGEDFIETMHHPLHYWLRIQDKILDITADQFNDEIDDEIEAMPIIVFDIPANLWRYQANLNNFRVFCPSIQMGRSSS